MELSELLRGGAIPQIGFGPGGMGYSPNMKKKRTGLSLSDNGMEAVLLYSK